MVILINASGKPTHILLFLTRTIQWWHITRTIVHFNQLAYARESLNISYYWYRKLKVTFLATVLALDALETSWFVLGFTLINHMPLFILLSCSHYLFYFPCLKNSCYSNGGHFDTYHKVQSLPTFWLVPFHWHIYVVSLCVTCSLTATLDRLAYPRRRSRLFLS
jgi:hypothetical protein